MKRILCSVLCLALLLACVFTLAGAGTTTIRVPSSPLTRPKQPEAPAESVEAAESVESVEVPAESAEAPETSEEAAESAESVEVPQESAEAPAESVEAETEKERKPLLRLHQIDIGCGDAYLLTVEDTVILVDCGSDTTDPIEVGHINYPLFGYLEACGIDHVDVHFVTHWHNDHCYNVGYFSAKYGTADTVVYGPSERILENFDPLPNGEYRQLKDGDRLSIGPVEVLCVSPARSDVSGLFNVDSLNFIVYDGEHTFLFTGDWLDRSVRQRWQAEITDIDVLSFPHHALQPLCVTEATYKTPNPRVVLIPSRERGTVRNFALHTVHVARDAVYLSSREGNVLVTSDGVDLWTAYEVEPGTYPLGEKVP